MTLTETLQPGRTTIATFNKIRTWELLAFMFAMLAFVLGVTFVIVSGFVRNSLPPSRMPFLVGSLPALWGGGYFIFRGSIRMLRQIIFDGGRRLWIEDGDIVECADSKTTIPCKDVETLSIGRMENYDTPAILIVAKDGSVMRLNIRGFAETPETIVERLTAAIPSLNRTIDPMLESKP